jgi:nitric oxide reductase large subunit
MVDHLADNPTMHRSRMRTFVAIVGAVTTIAVGVWFVVDAQGSMTNTAAVYGSAVFGIAGAVATPFLVARDDHVLAALAAFVAVVTPAGFAYLPNLLMVGIGLNELRLAWNQRRH